jgi:hypothetical protein
MAISVFPKVFLNSFPSFRLEGVRGLMMLGGARTGLLGVQAFTYGRGGEERARRGSNSAAAEGARNVD